MNAPDTLHVHASLINSERVYFECPFCHSSYKQNGEPKARAKRTTHVHSSDGDTSNRVILRGAHCESRFKYIKGQWAPTQLKRTSTVYITVDDATIRE